MILHSLNKIPEGYNSYNQDTLKLDSCDTSELEKQGVEEAWYWYICGSYEGSGQILMRKGDKYDIHDMGHCSCYGPTEYLNFIETYSSLDEIKDGCSDALWPEIEPLVELAKTGRP